MNNLNGFVKMIAALLSGLDRKNWIKGPNKIKSEIITEFLQSLHNQETTQKRKRKHITGKHIKEKKRKS